MNGLWRPSLPKDGATELLSTARSARGQNGERKSERGCFVRMLPPGHTPPSLTAFSSTLARPDHAEQAFHARVSKRCCKDSRARGTGRRRCPVIVPLMLLAIKKKFFPHSNCTTVRSMPILRRTWVVAAAVVAAVASLASAAPSATWFGSMPDACAVVSRLHWFF